MADERQPGPGAGRNSNRRRRFRNRKRSGPRLPAPEAPVGPIERASERDPERARRERRARRRQRNKGGQSTEYAVAPLPVEDNLDVVTPTAVYIYTHVIRPVVRDTYEYRSEHFSKVSRRLEDFNIDLSVLDRIEAEGILPPISARLTDDEAAIGNGEWDDDEYEEID